MSPERRSYDSLDNHLLKVELAIESLNSNIDRLMDNITEERKWRDQHISESSTSTHSLLKDYNFREGMPKPHMENLYSRFRWRCFIWWYTKTFRTFKMTNIVSWLIYIIIVAYFTLKYDNYICRQIKNLDKNNNKGDGI